jgi:hypothetical protein
LTDQGVAKLTDFGTVTRQEVTVTDTSPIASRNPLVDHGRLEGSRRNVPLLGVCVVYAWPSRVSPSTVATRSVVDGTQRQRASLVMPSSGGTPICGGELLGMVSWEAVPDTGYLHIEPGQTWRVWVWPGVAIPVL